VRRVAILGSTGSIGTQALDVIARHPDRFTVVGLAAGRNIARLREQAERFHPRVVSTADDGAGGLRSVALESDAQVILAATDGFIAFDAIFAAVERGIDIAVANKELIVAAGELLMRAAARSGSKVVPVDSEHSAIFQCLRGENRERIERIILTASGGPFRTTPATELANATVEQALAHPTWRMGTKNTIDSATLMNKGLEVIEAGRLFGLPGERIDVVVHPQSIVHGFVAFTDGSVKAQLGAPDMRVPIGYALAYPERLDTDGRLPEAPDSLAMLGAHPERTDLRYEFERPDPTRFPCLGLAYQALGAGGTAPAILSAANEVAVGAFVDGRLRFGQIPEVIEKVMQAVPSADLTLEGVRLADQAARERAAALVDEVVWCS
jgi:1-deoxy-D-xylulose-5-phosphate reductoisomerase